MSSERSYFGDRDSSVDPTKIRELEAAVARNLDRCHGLVEAGQGMRCQGKVVGIDPGKEQVYLRDVREEPSGMNHDAVFVTNIDFVLALSETTEAPQEDDR